MALPVERGLGAFNVFFSRFLSTTDRCLWVNTQEATPSETQVLSRGVLGPQDGCNNSNITHSFTH